MPLQTDTIHCRNCGHAVPADGRFCPNCRAPVVAAPPPPMYAAPPQAHQAYQAHRPYPAGGVGPKSSYMWAIAWLDAVGLVVDIATADAAFGASLVILLVSIVAAALLIGQDFDIMVNNLNAEHAHKKLSAALWVIGGALLTPVYLFRRASHTDRRYGPFALSVVCVSLAWAIGIMQGIAEEM